MGIKTKIFALLKVIVLNHFGIRLRLFTRQTLRFCVGNYLNGLPIIAFNFNIRTIKTLLVVIVVILILLKIKGKFFDFFPQHHLPDCLVVFFVDI